MVLLLLANGADPNIVCKDTSPLWLACYHGLIEVVHPLLDNGADPNFMSNGASSLHVAAARGLVEVCDIICSFPRGVNVNVRSDRLGTPLHVAVSRGHKYVLECLLKYSPDLSLTNRFGETPLHIACRLSDDSIALKLVNSKLHMDPFIKDTVHGSTVAHITTSLKLFRTLIGRWPQLLHSTDDYGRSPTFYMPCDILALFTSLTSKVAQQSGEDLLSDVDRYGDIQLVCPVFVSKLSSSSSPPSSENHPSSHESSQETEKAISTSNMTFETQQDSPSPSSHVVQLATEMNNASITIPTERILCHKAVLYSRCTYFRDQLRSSLTAFEPKTTRERHVEVTELSVPSVSADVMHVIVFYIYTDTLKSPRQLLEDVAATAKFMQLDRLEAMALGKLGKVVDVPEGTLSSDLLTMRTEASFADIQVHLPSKISIASNTDTHSFKLHRFVLAAFSEYFRTMFTAGLSESRTGIVELHPEDPLIFDAYLHFVYSFTLKPTMKTIAQCFSLLELSSSFISPDLSMPVQTRILSLLINSDWTQLALAIVESDRLEAHIVYEQCVLYYSSNRSLHNSKKFKLPADMLERLQKMAAPREEKPFVSAFVPPASHRNAPLSSLSTT